MPTTAPTTIPAGRVRAEARAGTIPIWVGGNTEAAYRRTARYGDAFHAAFEPLDDVRVAWAGCRSW